MKLLAAFDEPPPTAGLPLVFSDFFASPQLTLEQTLAQYLGVDRTQVECSGTAALVVALLTLKKQSARRSVVLTAYTCPWVAIAVLHCGLTPVLCDIQANHFELSLQSLEQVCGDDTLAIVPTHLAGRVADVRPIIDYAHRIGAYVIEDAAQSLGATLQNCPVGTFGDIGFYSLGVGKGLTIFAGGVLVAKDAHMTLALQQTSQQVVKKNLGSEWQRTLELIGYYCLYRPITMALVFGMPLRKALKRGDVIAAVGDDCPFYFPLHQVGNWRKKIGANAFNRLTAYFKLTQQQAAQRVALLRSIHGVQVMADASGGQGVWPFIILLMPTAESRDQVLAKLWQQKMGVGRLFIHALGDYQYLAPHFKAASTSNAREFAARSLIISNSLWLSEQTFMTIQKTIDECANVNR